MSRGGEGTLWNAQTQMNIIYFLTSPLHTYQYNNNNSLRYCSPRWRNNDKNGHKNE